MNRSTAPLRLHHLGIQTGDLANSLAWYSEFLDAREQWSLTEFSPLTRSRLPGIERLVELAVGEIRLHLFQRAGQPAPDPSTSVTAYQHVCIVVGSPEELVRHRERWLELYRSGRYSFALDDPATEVVTDDDGVLSFYAYDVNGLELEFTHIPETADR